MNCKNSTNPRRTSWWRSLATLCTAIFMLTAFVSQGQTVTITCTGAPGSFQSGSVNSAGTKNDGNMININSSMNRGWAHYDLSSIPNSATVTAVTANFTTFSTTSSGATNNVYGFTGDPAVIAGATLYANCASAPTLNASSWSANALQTKVLNAAGLAFIQANVGTNNANIGYVRGSTNNYNIAGYPGVSGPAPNLVITYFIPSPCNATPAPGNTTGPSAICPTISFTVGLQNPTSGTGVTYQWQMDTGLGFTNFGSNSSTQTVSQTVATSYQCIVTCAGNGSTTSNVLAVAVNPFTNCYCSSQAGNAADEEIYAVTVNGTSHGNGAADCTVLGPGPGSLLNRYANYRTIGSLTNLSQTTVVPFTVDENECDGATFFSFGTAIWVDYNQDGVFSDATEKVFVEGSTLTGPRLVTGSFTVPGTATLGVTGMRITVAEGFSGAGLTSCLAYGFGETHDYLVTITAPPLCQAPQTVMASNLTVTSADISWVCTGCSGNYIVEYGAPGFVPGTAGVAGGGTVWTGAPVASSPVTITGLSGLTSYAVYVRQNCGGTYSANSSVLNFTTPCATGSCNYIVRIGDLFGDGWDGSQWQLRQNGVTIAVIGPQLPGGCGPVDIPVSICSGSTISLHWTVGGSFTDEKALQLFDPFGVLVYDYRGPATYTSCPGVNWTSANSGSSCSFDDLISPLAGRSPTFATCFIVTSPGASLMPPLVVSTRDLVPKSV